MRIRRKPDASGPVWLRFTLACATRLLRHLLVMTTSSRPAVAFTILELLVVLAVLILLAALLLPALSRIKLDANRAVCIGNLKQIDGALRMYADDSSDKSPWLGQVTNHILSVCYKELIQEYVAGKGAEPSRQKLFACPADTFYYDLRPGIGQGYVPKPRHDQAIADFSSYSFNGGNQFADIFTNTPPPGIGGRTLGSVRHPARTAMVLEAPAQFPYSWHNPKHPLPVGGDLPVFRDARNVLGFVDGHVSYLKIFWNTNMISHPGGFLISLAADYDPPPGYEYQWSGD